MSIVPTAGTYHGSIEFMQHDSYTVKSIATAFVFGVSLTLIAPIIFKHKLLCSFVAGAALGVIAFIFYLYYLLDLPIHRYDASAQKLICTTPPYPTITGPY